MDHTCLRTNVPMDMILDRCCKNKACSSIALISDPGPHYRGYEALYFYLISTVESTTSEYIAAVRNTAFKSVCDKLFGCFSAYLEKAEENKKEILSKKLWSAKTPSTNSATHPLQKSLLYNLSSVEEGPSLVASFTCLCCCCCCCCCCCWWWWWWWWWCC